MVMKPVILIQSLLILKTTTHTCHSFFVTTHTKTSNKRHVTCRNTNSQFLSQQLLVTSSLSSLSIEEEEGVEEEFSMVSSQNDFQLEPPSPIPPTISMEEYFQRAQNEHDAQFQAGVKIFGSSATSCTTDTTDTNKYEHLDEDFKTYTIKEGYAGPSEDKLKNGNIIYETIQPILTDTDCEEYIQAAIQSIQKEKMEIASSKAEIETTSATQRFNSDLGEARLSQLSPKTIDKLQALLQNKLYPMLLSQFGPDHELTVYDGLIIGHVAPSMSQPVHRDASLLTLNIPLSSPGDFSGRSNGGGTYIEGVSNNVPLSIQKGNILSHSSGIMHAGIGIEQGQRWVMVLFLLSKDEPQIARRCHSEGLYAIQNQKLDDAMAAFEAGLTKAPHDHLLHMGVGQVASMHAHNMVDYTENQRKEMDQLSFDCLDRASKYYPLSHKASIAMGKMLLMKRKPRAALRRFDSVLSIINDDDLIDGGFVPLKALAWDARVSAARCAVSCAEWYAANKKNSFDGSIDAVDTNGATNDNDKTVWSNKLRLEQAIERIRIAMIPVPNDENLHYLMRRAMELLEISD